MQDPMRSVTIPAEIMQQLLGLPEAERADIARQLLESLGPLSALDDEAWLAEIKRRAEDVESGRSDGIPWDDFYAEARALLAK